MTTSTAASRRIPLVDLPAQHRDLAPEISAAIDRVFQSSHFILGEEVAAFETEFAAFCEVDEVVGCGNGTDALELALYAVGVRPGDEVITVAHTFAATAEAIVRCGAVPRFIDVRPDTLLMDVGCIEDAITSRTAAIVPVHLYGSCVDMPALMQIAERRGLTVVEDAAQAHGARWGGRRAGSFGTAACFSFYPGKNLGACGDAGAVATNDRRVADGIRGARDHGRVGKHEHAVVGRNSRMDAVQAAILRVKLGHLERWNEQRRQLASSYSALLSNLQVSPVLASADCDPVYHLYVVRVPDRDRVRANLGSEGITTGIHYPIPLHHQPAFAATSSPQVLPVTERAVEHIVSLPMFPELPVSDVERIATCLSASLTAG
ncbi:MAG: DegT/DnrJ/EryC1/StrS family aminotransferase [Candidatus Dormibacteraeota bacterium]|uniref:DegT/DnrJ/EryC1/StrS family aminotransferase n=1 Tax=Candidatus Aeolococcus gillhamiae TaxID=3127015 RepID=A0A934K0K2_9BACT|nr:DegT/DnrJ/EryC1/StrS family aminotransferase [Candidatus Dormibacteraeota bacterium]